MQIYFSDIPLFPVYSTVLKPAAKATLQYNTDYFLNKTNTNHLKNCDPNA